MTKNGGRPGRLPQYTNAIYSNFPDASNPIRYNETNLLIQFCWWCWCHFFLLFHFSELKCTFLPSFNYKLRLNNKNEKEKKRKTFDAYRAAAHRMHTCICSAQFVIAIATNAQTRSRYFHTCECVGGWVMDMATILVRRHNKNASTK